MDLPSRESEKLLERRVSFDPVAAVYDRVRHSYPLEAFGDLFSYLRAGGLAVSRSPEVVEIGPGTGKATQSLLDCGATVVGVELGVRMAAFLRAKFAGVAQLSVLQAPFESVDLALSSCDVVFAATAFHWVDAAVRVSRAVEVLRPRGVLATLSTIQVEAETSRGFFERGRPIYKRYRMDDAHDYVAPVPEEAVAPEYDEFAASPLLVEAVFHRYRWDQTYSTAQYSDLMRSYSNMQMMPADQREALIAELCELVDDELGGQVVRPLVIVLSMARRAEA